MEALDRVLWRLERECLNPLLFMELDEYGSILPVLARYECLVLV